MTKNILTLMIATVFSITLFAQQKTENCPLGGRENCTGFCGNFTDANKDGYCDYSKLKDNKDLKSDQPKSLEDKTAQKPHKCTKGADKCVKNACKKCDKKANSAEHKCCKDAAKCSNNAKNAEHKCKKELKNCAKDLKNTDHKCNKDLKEAGHKCDKAVMNCGKAETKCDKMGDKKSCCKNKSEHKVNSCLKDKAKK